MVGAEFTCHFPEIGLFCHVLAYGFDREQEVALDAKRRNIDDFLRFAAARNFTLRLRDKERALTPSDGRVVIVANHPIGSLDGLALLHLVHRIVPHVNVVANELLSILKPPHPALLPVTTMGGMTKRGNLVNLRHHLEEDGALIIFPAGEVSRFGSKIIVHGFRQPAGSCQHGRANRCQLLDQGSRFHGCGIASHRVGSYPPLPSPTLTC
jgi:putative hemolysin